MCMYVCECMYVIALKWDECKCPWRKWVLKVYKGIKSRLEWLTDWLADCLCLVNELFFPLLAFVLPCYFKFLSWGDSWGPHTSRNAATITTTKLLWRQIWNFVYFFLGENFCFCLSLYFCMFDDEIPSTCFRWQFNAQKVLTPWEVGSILFTNACTLLQAGSIKPKRIWRNYENERVGVYLWISF